MQPPAECTNGGRGQTRAIRKGGKVSEKGAALVTYGSAPERGAQTKRSKAENPPALLLSMNADKQVDALIYSLLAFNGYWLLNLESDQSVYRLHHLTQMFK